VDMIKSGKAMAVYVIASSMTSTIPGISLAGAAPMATLFTPALDVEYLFYGKCVTLDLIPTTPTGIPTPAIITKAALHLMKIPFVVVDAGSYVEPKIPHIRLSSRCVGRRIDKEDALPSGTSRNLFEEAKNVGRILGSIANIVLIGESMPGGTTTALAILQGLGYEAYNIVSSASKVNPIELKKTIVEKALKRLKDVKDPFTVNDVVGDSLHISIAGIALGALQAGSIAILAGGTQMLAALSLMKAINPLFPQDKVVIATTRWIFADKGKEITGFLNEVLPNVSLIYVDINFADAPFEGLRAYEEGYVKEGVGAGGTASMAVIKGFGVDDLKKAIFDEYKRLVEVRNNG